MRSMTEKTPKHRNGGCLGTKTFSRKRKMWIHKSTWPKSVCFPEHPSSVGRRRTRKPPFHPSLSRKHPPNKGSKCSFTIDGNVPSTRPNQDSEENQNLQSHRDLHLDRPPAQHRSGNKGEVVAALSDFARQPKLSCLDFSTCLGSLQA